MSTSKPRSAKPDAITFWPRSWPSCPIFATRIRGRRPASVANLSTASRVLRISSVSPNSDAYAPPTTLVPPWWRPKTSARVSEISPRVARALPATTASSSRLRGGGSCAPIAASLRAARQRWTSASLRDAFTAVNFFTWRACTEALSMMRALTRLSSFSRMNLFIPTTTSVPASSRACLRAAHSSMRCLGMPDSTALAIPPRASTSSITSSALS
mmetsp:Transcript_40575/g.96084  ORF Transcript_40575/g.96084 Transcript_40575/m.96084 type:complete len:214 (-) Transcript_40575:1456-2097(-)